MLSFLKRRLRNDKGAMDKIIVTLLLVIVGIGAVVGLGSWMDGQTTAFKNDVNTTLNTLKNN